MKTQHTLADIISHEHRSMFADHSRLQKPSGPTLAQATADRLVLAEQLQKQLVALIQAGRVVGFVVVDLSPVKMPEQLYNDLRQATKSFYA
jgi:hypothetical protein